MHGIYRIKLKTFLIRIMIVKDKHMDFIQILEMLMNHFQKINAFLILNTVIIFYI